MTKPRPILLALALLATGLLPGGTRAEDVFMGKPYSVPDTSELLTLTEVVKKAADEGSFDAVALKIQNILDFHRESVVLIGKVDDERFLGAREWAHDFLRRLPPEGLAAYRALAGPLAAKMIAAAAESRDPARLEEVVQRYYLSGEGPAARRALGALMLRGGRYAEAAWHLRALVQDFPSDARAEDRAELACALIRGGDADGFSRFVKADPEVLASREPLTAGGAATTLGDFLAPLEREWRALLDAPRGDPGSWPLYGRTPTRSEPVPPLSDFGADAWSMETRYRYKEQDTERNTFAFRGDFGRDFLREPLGPQHQPISPVVDGGVMYFQNGFSVYAVNLYTEKLLWVFDGPQRFTDGLTNRGTVLTLAVADGVVYANLEVAAPTPDRSNSQFLDRTVIYYLPQRRLFAIEAATGRCLWSHEDGGTRSKEDVETLKGLNENSAPLVVGDTVYVTTSRQSHRFFCQVLAVDAVTGRIRWHTRLCSGQQELNLFGRPLMELSSGAVSERDGILYCGSNLGVVAALDRRSGEIVWMKGYPQVPLPLAVQWHYTPERAPTWANNPPIVTEDAVYFTPTDSRHLLSLNRADGSLRFLFDGGDPMNEEPVFANLLGVGPEHIYVSGPKVLAIHRRTGKVAWGRRQGEFPRPPGDAEADTAIGRGFVTKDAVFTATTRALVAFDPQTGAVKSEVPLTDAKEDLDAPVRFAGNLVLADQVLLVAHRERITAHYIWEQVYAELRRRQKEEPRNARLSLEIGQVCARRERFDEAIEAFGMALKLAELLPEDERAKTSASARRGLFEIRLLRGRRLVAAEDREKALKEFELAAAAAVEPLDRVRALLEIADCRRVAGDARGLKAVYEQLAGDLRDVPYEFPSLGQIPAGLFALLNLTEMALDAGRPAEAVAALARVLAEHPGAPMLGGRDSGSYARERIDRLIAEHGRAVYAPLEERAQTLFAGATKAESVEGFEAVVRLFPNSLAAARAAVELGRFYFRGGNFRDAATALRRAQAEFPRASEMPAILYLLSRALEERGYLLAARSALQRLAREFPKAEISEEGRRLIAGEYAASRLAEERYQNLVAKRLALNPPLKELWAADEGGGAYVRILEPAGVAPPGAEELMLVGTNGVLRAVRGATKETLWQLPLNGIVTRPAWSEGTLVLVNSDGLLGVEALTGKELWRRATRASIRAVAAVPGSVFVLSTDPRDPRDVTLRAFGPRSGEDLWERRLANHTIFELLLVTEDSVAVASREPAGIEVFDAATGRPRFSVAMEPRTLYREPFLVDEDKLFLAHANQRLELYEMSTGRRLFSVDLPENRSYRSGVPVPGGIFVTDQAENLMVVEAATGKTRWTSPPPAKTALQYQCEEADDLFAYVVRRREADGVYCAEAHSLATGATAWKADLLAAKSATPVPIATDAFAVFHVNSFDFGQNAWTSETVFLEKQTGKEVQRIAAAKLAGLFTYVWVGDGLLGLYAGGKVAVYGGR